MNEEQRPDTPQTPAPCEFDHGMSRVQIVLGSIMLPVHIIVLPVLMGFWSMALPEPMGEGQMNFLVYAVSAVLLLVILFPWWRDQFHRLLERFGRCLLSLITGGAAYYAASVVMGLILMLIFGQEELLNPNNQSITQIARTEMGQIKAAAIFLGPLVEEGLYRGVLFGSVRRRSRVWAYVLSTVLFCLIHVWQYAALSGDLSMLLYGLQYVPAALILARTYERSGSIWTGVFLHMLINVFAFAVLT